MAFQNPVSVSVQQALPVTAVVKTTVAVSTTAFSVAAANTNRKNLTIWNDSTHTVLLDFDTDPTLSSFAGILEPQGQFVLDSSRNGVYTGSVRAIGRTGGALGGLLVREFS